MGACYNEVKGCIDGQPPDCFPGIPTVEVCDEIDNDCNGEVDDVPEGCDIVEGGDGSCDPPEEDCGLCPGDCGECCGDGDCVADHAEDCSSCAADCGACCGDGECKAEHNEDCSSCSQDCGACCGDGECKAEHNEDCTSCLADCGECCGDGQCQEAQQLLEPEAEAVKTPSAVQGEAEKPLVKAPSMQPGVAAPKGVEKLPPNLQLREENLFALDTTQREFELTLHGTRNFRLVGRLADQEGRRSIVLTGRRAVAEEVVFAADWLLPAVGAVSVDGNMLVCVNRLVGEPSELTEGNMADPTGGVELACRARNDGRWEKEVTLGKGGVGQWIHDVTATADGGFRVSYNDDKTGLLVDDPEEGEAIYRVPFKNGRFHTPEMALKTVPPM